MASYRSRIGIESGEVVVGDPFGGATMATGDAMNVAARLEQQAEPGEVVVGANVYEAVRDLVKAEPLGELALRGHEARVPGWRVQSVSADVGRPRGVPGLEAPLTGRNEELAALLDAAAAPNSERKAALFTDLRRAGRGQEPAHRARPRPGSPRTAGRSTAVAACPTARASPTGRWRKCASTGRHRPRHAAR